LSVYEDSISQKSQAEAALEVVAVTIAHASLTPQVEQFVVEFLSRAKKLRAEVAQIKATCDYARSFSKIGTSADLEIPAGPQADRERSRQAYERLVKLMDQASVADIA